MQDHSPNHRPLSVIRVAPFETANADPFHPRYFAREPEWLRGHRIPAMREEIGSCLGNEFEANEHESIVFHSPLNFSTPTSTVCALRRTHLDLRRGWATLRPCWVCESPESRGSRRDDHNRPPNWSRAAPFEG